MKKLIITLSVFLPLVIPCFAHAAIAYDNGTTNAWSAVTPQVFSYTVSSNNSIIILGMFTNGNTSTGCTFNGNTMTRFTGLADTGGNYQTMYYILGQSGTHNISCSFSSAVDSSIVVTSYSGVKQSGFPDSSNTSSGLTGKNVSLSTNVVASNAWLVASARDQNGTFSAGTGTVIRERESTVNETMSDSNGTVSTGSQSLAWSSASSQTMNGIILVSIAPFVASPASPPAQDIINFQ